MAMRMILFSLFVYSLSFNYNGVKGYRKLSSEEDLTLEKELKRLNKPAVKTIQTKYGDIYDCVDFYKQPAFDHPLLKNHSYYPEMKPTFIPERLRPHTLKRKYKAVKTGLEGGGCPIGTVPIRRTTKDDLLRAKFSSKKNYSTIHPLTAENPGLHLAVVRSRADTSDTYYGIQGSLSLFNPSPVAASQYSKGHIKIQNGDDALQTGWMVNPDLYGDTRTRMFIQTDAGAAGVHCFNLQCAGFTLVNTNMPVDMILEPTSTYGGSVFGTTFRIRRDANGDWWLFLEDNIQIGFWPNRLFTGLGSYVHWGGEIFSPPAIVGPSMGFGRLPIEADNTNCASCEDIAVDIGGNEIIHIQNVETFTDAPTYFQALDGGNRGGEFQHIIFYGGLPGIFGN